jgi:capsular exopolysaccharide synthesis family protein
VTIGSKSERRLQWQGKRSFQISEDAIRLAARLKAALRESDKVLLFTGAVAGEGTSTVAMQVAFAFAQMDVGAVLLLDANLHAPSAHTTFQVPQSPGFTDLIEQQATPDHAIHPTEMSRLYVLPVGSTVVNALALFSALECTALLRTLAQRFRLIVIDSAPVLQSADTTLLVPHTDGVVLVIAAGERRHAEVLEIQRLLEGVKARLLGVVLSDRSGRLA